MCIEPPPPPPVRTPAPAPTPAPTPPPAPAPGNPPGPPPPAVVINMGQSRVIDSNGISKTFNQVIADNGFESSVGPGASGTVRLEIALDNVSSSAQNPTLQVYPSYTELSISPTQNMAINMAGGQKIIATFYCTPTQGNGGLYEVFVSLGGTVITLKLAISFI